MNHCTEDKCPREIPSPHLYGWCPETIRENLEIAGFADIQFMPEQIPHRLYNFRVEAKKRMKTFVEIKNNDSKKKLVTVEIPTKNRYDTTLPLAILSVLNQTVKPHQLIIVDDGDHLDLREIPVYKNILHRLDQENIKWTLLYSEKKGQVAIHEYILRTCDTEFIWRLDDDNVAESNVLETLLKNMDPKVGAVGGLS